MTDKPTPTDAELKALREANMQLVRTGDDAARAAQKEGE